MLDEMLMGPRPEPTGAILPAGVRKLWLTSLPRNQQADQWCMDSYNKGTLHLSFSSGRVSLANQSVGPANPSFSSPISHLSRHGTHNLTSISHLLSHLFSHNLARGTTSHNLAEFVDRVTSNTKAR